MKMSKKNFMTSLFVLIVATASYAEVSFGASFVGGSGVGSIRMDSLADAYGKSDDSLNTVGGFSLNSHISFGDGKVRFMIQPEAVMLFNNGVGNGFHFTYDDYTLGIEGRSDGSISVTTIDLPLLLGSDFVEGNWILTAYAGPYLSIPVAGTCYIANENINLKYDMPAWGLAAGFGANTKFGPGSMVFDVRYYFDLSPVKMINESTGESMNVYARRAIVMSAGYSFSL